MWEIGAEMERRVLTVRTVAELAHVFSIGLAQRLDKELLGAWVVGERGVGVVVLEVGATCG